MFDSFFYALTVFLMLTGIIALIYFIIMKLLTPRKRSSFLQIIPLFENENPTGHIAAAIEKRNLCGEARYCDIIAVDMGLSEDTRAYLENMYFKSDKFLICDYDSLSQVIASRLSGTMAKIPNK